MNLKQIIKEDKTTFTDYINEKFEANFQEYIIKDPVSEELLVEFFSEIFKIPQKNLFITPLDDYIVGQASCTSR